MDNGDGNILVDEYFDDFWDEEEKAKTSGRRSRAISVDAFVDEQCSGRCYHVRSRFSGPTDSLSFKPHLPL